MAKTVIVRLFPQGQDYGIPYEGNITVTLMSEKEIRFSIRTETARGVEVRSVCSTLPYIIEERLLHLGTISV